MTSGGAAKISREHQMKFAEPRLLSSTLHGALMSFAEPLLRALQSPGSRPLLRTKRLVRQSGTIENFTRVNPHALDSEV